MALNLSCALATSMATPDHVAIAEALGYGRAWLYDSPALYPDVWIQLARSAERTSTIGIGPGVLIPSLRHPMTTAAAIATVAELAGPGRLAIAVGSGFTGRFTLGQRPLRWAEVGAYVRAVRALLRGEVVEWEGGHMQMLHPEGFGARRPIEVPFLIGAAGPKGIAVAHEVADGLFVSGPMAAPGFDWVANLFFGTVLDEGEDAGSERVLAAAGHAAAVRYHFFHEHRLPLDQLPNADAWLDAYEEVPANVRHLAMHDLHLIGINERDRPFVTAELLDEHTYTAAELREQCAHLEQAGVTEIAYQPAGPDIARELEAFAAAFQG